MAGSSLFGLEGPSATSLGGRAPKATDGDTLFGILCRETGVKMVGKPTAVTPKPTGVAG